MFVAAKFEEIDPPRATDFVYITDNTYSKAASNLGPCPESIPTLFRKSCCRWNAQCCRPDALENDERWEQAAT